MLRCGQAEQARGLLINRTRGSLGSGFNKEDFFAPENFKKDIAFIFKRLDFLTFLYWIFSPFLG